MAFASHVSFFYSTNQLNQIANANKSTQCIHSDLSVSNSSRLGRLIWSLLSIKTVIGKSIRNTIFNTNLENAKQILVQHKALVQNSNDEQLKKLFESAVINFKQIAPNLVVLNK